VPGASLLSAKKTLGKKKHLAALCLGFFLAQALGKKASLSSFFILSKKSSFAECFFVLGKECFFTPGKQFIQSIL